MTQSDIMNAKTSELIEFYNSKSETKVKKFADRRTAEKRCMALLGLGNDKKERAEDDAVKIPVPAKKAPAKKAPAKKAPAKKAPAKKKDDLHERMSEAQRESWKVKEIAEARAERSAVMVDKTEYKSVRAAFVALKLPIWKHIKFRGELKEAVKLTAFGHKWSIIPLNY